MKPQMTELMERRGKAQDSVKVINANSTARKLLDEGIRTGTFADFRQGFGRALLTIGVGDPESKDLTANTDAFAANAGQAVMAIIKNFGAGTGLSDADREYAAKIAGGTVEINEEAIRKILDINDRASREVIRRYNVDAEQIPEGYSLYNLPVEAPSNTDLSDLSDEDLFN